MNKIEKKCPKCGKIFFCHNDSTCWCMTISMSDELKGRVSRDYTDCLCKECLIDMGAQVITGKQKK